MLQHTSMCNLKFSAITALIKGPVGTRGNGLWMAVGRVLTRKTRSGPKLTRRACPPSQKDVDQQQDRQSQADSEMNPTRPRTQSFAARVIKAVAGDSQNGERTQKQRAVCAVTAPRAMRISHDRSKACRSIPESPSRPRRGPSSRRSSRLSRKRPTTQSDNSNRSMPRRSKKAVLPRRRENISASASIESSPVAGVAWRVKQPGWRTIALKQQCVRMILRQQARGFFSQRKNNFRQRIRYYAFRSRDA